MYRGCRAPGTHIRGARLVVLLRLLRTCLALALISLQIGACGSDVEEVGDVVTASGSAEQDRKDYRVILAGAATDTLAGRAIFGRVINPRTQGEQLVVKLETGVDFVGGVFIARGISALPEARSYSLANAAEVADTSLGGGFILAYQEGLLRQLSSRDGTVTFTHVSDTLISGSLEATLRGAVATGRGGEMRPGEIHMSGRFDARRGMVGFIVGI